MPFARFMSSPICTATMHTELAVTNAYMRLAQVQLAAVSEYHAPCAWLQDALARG